MYTLENMVCPNLEPSVLNHSISVGSICNAKHQKPHPAGKLSPPDALSFQTYPFRPCFHSLLIKSACTIFLSHHHPVCLSCTSKPILHCNCPLISEHHISHIFTLKS